MMTLFKTLKVGQRINVLTGMTLIFLMVIGGVGYYKMNQIGHELEGITERDIPLTEMLSQITVHQLEQAIMLEQIMRLSGITGSDSGHSVQDIQEKFKKLAVKVDAEILKAEEMAERFSQEAHLESERAEFSAVLAQLKSIEKQHKAYDDHAFAIIKKVENGVEALSEADKTELFVKVNEIETEQSRLDKEVATLLGKVEDFTLRAAQTALADEERGKMLILVMAILILIVASLLSFFIGRSITRPVSDMTDTVRELAKGNLEADIPAIDFKDELNEMSEAMVIFRQSMRDAEEQRAKRREEQMRRQRQTEELNQLTGIFGATIGAVFSQILEGSTIMVNRAASMKTDSGETKDMAYNVSREASDSSSSAGTLSAATEEMVSSVQEIASQVAKSSEVTKQAVLAAEQSQSEVGALKDIADEIGNVVQLITDIAEQTNLLALNATIEAARAGEAGKGFAVVANEVKSLASQTAKATEEISEKIGNIQEASQTSAQSIAEIGQVITQVDDYVTSIVAAVEEQNSVTQEMARNVDFVAQSASRVAENVEGITSQAENVGDNANHVSDSATAIADDAETLSKEVKTFLDAMQNTAGNEGTFTSKSIHADAIAKFGTREWKGEAHEISAAHVVVKPLIEAQAGEKLRIQITGLNGNIEGRIARNEGGSTIIQFPLDLDHLDQMSDRIRSL